MFNPLFKKKIQRDYILRNDKRNYNRRWVNQANYQNIYNDSHISSLGGSGSGSGYGGGYGGGFGGGSGGGSAGASLKKCKHNLLLTLNSVRSWNVLQCNSSFCSFI